MQMAVGVEHGFHLGEESVPRARQSHAAAVPLQHGCNEFGFEFPQAQRERRLRDVQLGGGAMDRAEFSDTIESFELRDADPIHWKNLSKRGKPFNWTGMVLSILASNIPIPKSVCLRGPRFTDFGIVRTLANLSIPCGFGSKVRKGKLRGRGWG